MIIFLIGSQGKLGSILYKSMVHLSKYIYTFDSLNCMTTEVFRTHYCLDVSNPDFFQLLLMLFKKHANEKLVIIYTPALDYPVSKNTPFSSSRFSVDLETLSLGFQVGLFPIYELIRVAEAHDLTSNLMIIGFDSIYANSLPTRSYYTEGIKPLAYSLSKAPMELLFKAYSADFSRPDNTCRSYLIRLSTVDTPFLPEEFKSKFLEFSHCTSLVDLQEIVNLVKWLIIESPAGLSGTVIKLTCNYFV